MNGIGTTSGRGRLRVHLLGSLDFDAVVQLQRGLVYELAGEGAALILCEHPPLITIGRHGSPGHIRLTTEELASRRWPVRWVSRGGGTILHLPGQLAIYPILPLNRFALDVPDYVAGFQQILLRLLADFDVVGSTRTDQAGVWVGDRLIAAIGVAVRQQMTTFGASLNVDPDLLPFRWVQSGLGDELPMTSLARERRGPLRAALVRQRLVEHFREGFGFDEADVIFPGAMEAGHVRLAARS